MTKTILITGASSGIGKATALTFAKQHDNVILCGRDQAKLEAAKAEAEKVGAQAAIYSFDVTNYQEVQEHIQKILENHGDIDVLVNNAGIAHWNSIENVTDEDFDNHMKANVYGQFNLIKALTPHLIKNKAGTIINIISGAGKNARPNTVAYTTSKFAAAGMNDAVFEDLNKYGINVTAIYPGKTNTPIHEIPADDPKRAKMLDPQVVADAIVYAASVPASAKLKELVIRPPE